jgi:hypothetical protein
VKITKKQLRRIIREELERQPVNEDMSTVIVLLPMLAAVFASLTTGMAQGAAQASAYSSYSDYEPPGIIEKWKHNRMLKRAAKNFPPEAIGELYNLISAKHPEVLEMISSNKDRYAISRTLEKFGLAADDADILRRVAIMLKQHHRNYKKSMKSLNKSMPKG